MNIEIANRLTNLRKEKGLSQEQLAESLGISRQAVSKWERAEASPDTDNLIELARLYNVSIDYLVCLKQEKEEKDKVEGNEEKILITDDIVDTIELKDNQSFSDNKYHKFKKIYDTCLLSACTITYLLLGSLMGIWHPAWLIFLLMITLSSIPEMIYKKKISDFNYSVFITTIYLFLGFVFNLWHPYWFLFITIPVFHIVAGSIDKHFKK